MILVFILREKAEEEDQEQDKDEEKSQQVMPRSPCPPRRADMPASIDWDCSVYEALWKRRLQRKPDAGNPHVRFDEGEEGDGITAVPSLLYRFMVSDGALRALQTLISLGSCFREHSKSLMRA